MYPHLDPAREVGVQFINFSEFDNKCVENPMEELPTCDASNEEIKRYNDIPHTIGSNLLTISRTRMLGATTRFSQLLFRSVLTLGYKDDTVTNYLQNESPRTCRRLFFLRGLE